jgi:two-component system chemotaxis response regulator CheB
MRGHGHNSNVIVVGGSNGGLDAFISILEGLDKSFQLPLVLVLHQQRNAPSLLVKILSAHTTLNVKEPVDKEKIDNGHVYVAPPDYHLLLEPGKTFSYSYSELINFSRPSIDILFETAAACCGSEVVGVLLTGANSDGAAGLRTIITKGGMAIVQDPTTAKSPEMPRAAINFGCTDHIADLQNITLLLNNLNHDYLSRRSRATI